MAEDRALYSREDPDPLLPATDAPSAAVGADGPPEYEIVNAADANWEEHPDAAIFGMLQGKEYEQFRDGIKEAGIIFEPVDLVKGPDGSWLLADGRNRRKVAKELDLPLKVNRLPDGTDVKAHIISKNLHRRHLKPSQLDWFAANMVTVRRGDFHGNQHTRGDGIGNVADTKPRTIPEAAALTGRSERTVQEALHVKDHDPEAFEAMRKGEITTSAAGKRARGKRKPPSNDKGSRGGSRGKSKPLPLSLAGFTTGFKPALAVFENAKLPVQKEIVKKTATDFNAVIFFAGEEFRPQPVSMFGNGGAPANPVMQVNKPKFEELHDCGRQVGAVGRSAPKTPETPEQQSLPTGDAAEAPSAAAEPVIEPLYFPGLQAVMDRRSDRMEDIDITAEGIIPPPWKTEGIAAEAVDVTSGEIPFPWRAEGIAASTLEQRLGFVREFDPELAGQVEKDKTKLEDAEAIVLELMAAMRSVLEYKLTSEEEQALVRYKARFPDGVAEKEMEAAKKALEEIDAACEAAVRARDAKGKKLRAKLIKGADAEALEALAHKITEEVEDSGIDIEDREAVRDEGGIDAIFERAITNEINAELDAMGKGLITPEALEAAAAENYTEEQFTDCVIADLVTKAVKLAKAELRG